MRMVKDVAPLLALVVADAVVSGAAAGVVMAEAVVVATDFVVFFKSATVVVSLLTSCLPFLSEV